MEPFLQRYPDTNHEPLDIEQLVRLGTARGPCPFYLAREMTRNAELVFMPYNYLIDGRTRAGLSMLSLENAVLIFDEAHNVEVRLSVSLGLKALLEMTALVIHCLIIQVYRLLEDRICNFQS